MQLKNSEIHTFPASLRGSQSPRRAGFWPATSSTFPSSSQKAVSVQGSGAPTSGQSQGVLTAPVRRLQWNSRLHYSTLQRRTRVPEVQRQEADPAQPPASGETGLSDLIQAIGPAGREFPGSRVRALQVLVLERVQTRQPVCLLPGTWGLAPGVACRVVPHGPDVPGLPRDAPRDHTKDPTPGRARISCCSGGGVQPPMCIPRRAGQAGPGGARGTPPGSPSPRAPAARGRPRRARPRVTAGRAPFVCGPSAAAAPLARPPGGPAPSWLASCICMSAPALPRRPLPAPSRAGVRGARRGSLLAAAGARARARARARASRACSGRAAAAAPLQPCQRARAWAHHEPWPCP